MRLKMKRVEEEKRDGNKLMIPLYIPPEKSYFFREKNSNVKTKKKKMRIK